MPGQPKPGDYFDRPEGWQSVQNKSAFCRKRQYHRNYTFQDAFELVNPLESAKKKAQNTGSLLYCW
jgi:hypothetical protein